MIPEPTYLAARMVAGTLETHFGKQWEQAGSREQAREHLPRSTFIEAIIDAAFWASLQREEGYSPKISLAFLEPKHTRNPLIFGQKVRLTPYNLVKLSPAVTHPGLHLGRSEERRVGKEWVSTCKSWWSQDD